MTDRRILVPVNGSPTSERALPVAADLSRRLGRDVHLICVVDDPGEVARESGWLDGAAGQLTSELEDLRVTSQVVVADSAPEAIASEANEDTLVVMATGTQIYSLDHYVGSAAETVVRRSGQPVVLVGPNCIIDSPLELDGVVVPLDGSELASDAIELGRRWARQLERPLRLVSILPPETATIADLRGSLPAVEGVEMELVYGDAPATGIVHAAGPDGLIVMSTHGRSGLARMAMGSVTTDVVRLALRPVIVIRPSTIETRPDGDQLP